MATDTSDDVLHMAPSEADPIHLIHLIEFTRSPSEFRLCLAEVPALNQIQERGGMVNMWEDEPKLYMAPELVNPTKTKLQYQPVLMKREGLQREGNPNDDINASAGIGKWVRWSDLRGRHVMANEACVELVFDAVRCLRKSLSIRPLRRGVIEVDIRNQVIAATSVNVPEEHNQLLWDASWRGAYAVPFPSVSAINDM